ncbi:unnamed protein product [Amoebophrya sp. A120]|nr:unnamed protein product [Amoebophrya sp. A120]|eukprot:GSA120T00025377001.1
MIRKPLYKMAPFSHGLRMARTFLMRLCCLCKFAIADFDFESLFGNVGLESWDKYAASDANGDDANDLAEKLEEFSNGSYEYETVRLSWDGIFQMPGDVPNREQLGDYDFDGDGAFGLSEMKIMHDLKLGDANGVGEGVAKLLCPSDCDVSKYDLDENNHYSHTELKFLARSIKDQGGELPDWKGFKNFDKDAAKVVYPDQLTKIDSGKDFIDIFDTDTDGWYSFHELKAMQQFPKHGPQHLKEYYDMDGDGELSHYEVRLAMSRAAHVTVGAIYNEQGGDVHAEQRSDLELFTKISSSGEDHKLEPEEARLALWHEGEKYDRAEYNHEQNEQLAEHVKAGGHNLAYHDIMSDTNHGHHNLAHAKWQKVHDVLQINGYLSEKAFELRDLDGDKKISSNELKVAGLLGNDLQTKGKIAVDKAKVLLQSMSATSDNPLKQCTDETGFCDFNGDGSLTAEEIKLAKLWDDSPPTAKVSTILGDIFPDATDSEIKGADFDGDGHLSQKEIALLTFEQQDPDDFDPDSAANKKLLPAILGSDHRLDSYKMLDGDDKKLSLEELRLAVKHPETKDLLTAQDLHTVADAMFPSGSDNAHMLDFNGDGKLENSELLAAGQLGALVNTNGKAVDLELLQDQLDALPSGLRQTALTGISCDGDQNFDLWELELYVKAGGLTTEKVHDSAIRGILDQASATTISKEEFDKINFVTTGPKEITAELPMEWPDFLRKLDSGTGNDDGKVQLSELQDYLVDLNGVPQPGMSLGSVANAIPYTPASPLALVGLAAGGGAAFSRVFSSKPSRKPIPLSPKARRERAAQQAEAEATESDDVGNDAGTTPAGDALQYRYGHLPPPTVVGPAPAPWVPPRPVPYVKPPVPVKQTPAPSPENHRKGGRSRSTTQHRRHRSRRDDQPRERRSRAASNSAPEKKRRRRRSGNTKFSFLEDGAVEPARVFQEPTLASRAPFGEEARHGDHGTEHAVSTAGNEPREGADANGLNVTAQASRRWKEVRWSRTGPATVQTSERWKELRWSRNAAICVAG